MTNQVMTKVNAYLLKVDGILDSKGLSKERHKAKQSAKRVDMTLDKLRAMQRESKLTVKELGLWLTKASTGSR